MSLQMMRWRIQESNAMARSVCASVVLLSLVNAWIDFASP